MNADRVRELFDYDPLSGVLTWRVDKARAKAGDEAGHFTPEGYLRVGIDGREYMVHRVIWLWIWGVWPEHEIDHVNTDQGCNRWDNLRDATSEVNRQNQLVARADSALQLQGVKRHRKKFKARITVDKRQLYLGLFSTPELAHAAYVDAKRLLHKGNTL